jgi:hypothetical protein
MRPEGGEEVSSSSPTRSPTFEVAFTAGAPALGRPDAHRSGGVDGAGPPAGVPDGGGGRRGVAYQSHVAVLVDPAVVVFPGPERAAGAAAGMAVAVPRTAIERMAVSPEDAA